MQNKNNNKKAYPQCQKHSFCRRGYTIIETMITVSLFIIIVMAGMGALLNANLVHQKSSDMRSIMDNLSFIMDDMSRNLRTGYDYHCIVAGDPIPIGEPNPKTKSCDGGGGISFKSTNPISQWVYYMGTIDGNAGIFRSTNGGSTFIKLTPDEVIITMADSGFTVLGAEPPALGNQQQPFATINLVGKIILKNNVETPFSLQTSVSQRKIDIDI